MTPLSFVVELAASPAARERGLMDRTVNSGMLFLFERPVLVSFWNQRTLLPLDLFYLNARGDVVTRHAMQSITESKTPLAYRASSPFTSALELPRGLAPAETRRVYVGPVDYPRCTAVVTLI